MARTAQTTAKSSKKPKRPPLTNAERQRRYRNKRQAEFEAAMRGIPPAAIKRSKAEGDRFAALLQEIKHHKANTRQARAELEPLQRQLDGLRLAIRTVLARMSPAALQVARTALTEWGYIEWLDADRSSIGRRHTTPDPVPRR